MRLSESLRRNIMEANVGGIVNRFKIRKRRVTLFFGDIFMRYIEECEGSGHKKEMKSIAEEWMLHYFNVLVPASLKSLPLLLLNAVMRKVWINLGLMDDFRIVRKGYSIEIHTKNEAISKNIGSNMFSVGLFSGVLKGMFGMGMEEVSVMQSKTSNKYVFRVTESSQPPTESKKKESYNSLNRYRSKAGTDLKKLIKKNIFSLDRGNKIFFRGNAIYPVENTLFHLIGTSAIKQERIPEISYDFFRNAIDDVTPEKKLSMLKAMLEAMGWGNIIIIVQGDSRIVLEINNPPYGLQRENDNWSFLIRTILGYIWLIDNGFRLAGVTTRNKRLRAEFACSHPAPVVAV